LGSEPDVTVVVIVYNDAQRLPRAVRSVLDQSLRGVEVVLVDDASTDTTPQVTEVLVAAHPDRVHAIRLAENSGGCGRPRNAGIEQARGRYVMFLDSDDTLDRHACRNLVAAAEESGADLFSGRCVRVFTDREQSWYPSLYRQSRVHTSITDVPDLLYDTLSTNKCYRREFLDREKLSFNENLHYEDLLFSAQAYLAARTIAVIPHRVYNWFVIRQGEALSITNRRAELRNFADRLEIHRLIDAALRARGADELARSKNVKFLNHDLLLYLRELRSREPEYREAFLDLAHDYLAGLDPSVLEECNRLPAIAALMVMHRDAEATVAAADYAPKHGGRPTLSTGLVERDGRVYWSDTYLDTEADRRVLDVTDLGIHSAPFATLNLGERVTTMSPRDGRLHLAGDVVNPLGRIPAGAELGGSLEIRDRRRKRRSFRVPVSLRHEGDRKVLVRLPIRTGTVVFESHLGAQYSDNPKYIHRELLRTGAPHKAIWSYTTSSKGFPADAKLVRRGSWAYYHALARAEFWVDNQGMPAGLVKRPRTTYIQTWHGSAYKRMGFDEPAMKAATHAEQRRVRRMVGRFDHIVVRSEHDISTLVKGLGVTAEPLTVGYPRNDELVTGGDPDELAALRTRLGIDDDRTVVLYAPTFRPGDDGRPAKHFDMPFDLDRFARELGQTHILLVRPHYLSGTVIPPSLRGTVIDVGAVHDITPLLLISDALVTDYSSVMFDYALRDRPMIFFTADSEDYLGHRGSYFDLAAHAPGPIVDDEPGLLAALRDLEGVRRDHAERRRAFVERFGEYDTGAAAQAIVARFFPGGHRG
jgi:CDP-glycerol glycerophosphotransferase (TagB/SpsB family)/glycosyltransferase involved in cell wall biosynthesis